MFICYTPKAETFTYFSLTLKQTLNVMQKNTITHFPMWLQWKENIKTRSSYTLQYSEYIESYSETILDYFIILLR